MGWVINGFNGDGQFASVSGTENFSVATDVLIPSLALDLDLAALLIPPLNFNRLRGAWVDLQVEVTVQAQPPSRKFYEPEDSNQFFPALEIRYVDPAGRVTAVVPVRSSGVVLPQAHWVDRVGQFASQTKTLFSSGENVQVFVGVGGLYATRVQVYAQRGQEGLINYDIWQTLVGTFPTDDPNSYTLTCGDAYFTY